MKIEKVKMSDGREWEVILLPLTAKQSQITDAVKKFGKKCYNDASFHPMFRDKEVVSPHLEVFCDGDYTTWPVAIWPDGVVISAGGEHRIGRE